MAWRDELSRVVLPDGRQLIGASFRGIPFFVNRSSRSGGRRTVRHEFPKRNEPEIDDMGARAVDFSVEGYVLGEDYLRERDALITALEGVEGPGELIHPFYGRRRVQCASLTVQESISDGGVATFSIGFQDAPEIPAPTEVPDFDAAVADSSEDAITANTDELSEIYDVEGQPSFATASLAAEYTAIAEAYEASMSLVVSTTQEAARLAADIDILTASAASLIRDPVDAVDQLLATSRKLVETIAGAPLKVVNALLDAYDTPRIPDVLGTTATRDQERDNQAALADSLRRLLVIEAARLLPSVTFDSHGEAIAIRDEIVDALDTLALTAGNTAYPALITLRASLILAIPGDETLARITELNRRSEVSSLLLSYQLYGTADRESDLIGRNNPQHPGFMAGAITVLGDV